MVCLFSFSSFPISIEISHSLFEKMLFFAFLFLCVCVFPDLDQFLISQHICVKKKKKYEMEKNSPNPLPNLSVHFSQSNAHLNPITSCPLPLAGHQGGIKKNYDVVTQKKKGAGQKKKKKISENKCEELKEEKGG